MTSARTFLVGGPTDRLETVGDLDLASPVDGLTVDSMGDGAQHQVADEHRQGADGGFEHVAVSAQGADRSRAPGRRRGVDAPDVHAVEDDDPGAEEADSRDDMGGDPGEVDGPVLDTGRRATGHEQGQQLEQRGTERGTEGVGAKPRHARAPPVLGADQGAEHQGDAGTTRERGRVATGTGRAKVSMARPVRIRASVDEGAEDLHPDDDHGDDDVRAQGVDARRAQQGLARHG